MISKVIKALYCIRGHISTPGLEENLAGCQIKQLANLLEEPGLSTIFKLLKEEAYLYDINKDILSHFRMQPLTSAYVYGYPTLQYSQNPLSRHGRNAIFTNNDTSEGRSVYVLLATFIGRVGHDGLCYGGGGTE